MTEQTLISNAVDANNAKPSPEGEGWVTTAGMQEVEQRKEQLPRGNQNKEKSLFESPHPSLIMADSPVRHPAGECKSAPGGFVPEGEGAHAVYVYEKPVRLWHSLNALVIVALTVTGYLIASPFASVGGEASDHFVMGYVRFLHFAAGYLLAIGLIFRAYWAYAGNEHARQIFMPPLLLRDFWLGVGHEILWYAFLVKEPKKYVGHNPLAVLFMHFVFVWGMVFMIVTGFALYGEGTGQGTWQHALFSSWVLPMFGDSQNLHSWHHLVMWLIVCFVLTHIYVAVREDRLSRQTILSAIVSGESLFLRKLLWASLPNKRQKLRDRSCLRRPQPSCFFCWIPSKGYPTSFSQ